MVLSMGLWRNGSEDTSKLKDVGDQEGLKIDVLMPVGLVSLKVKGSLFFPLQTKYGHAGVYVALISFLQSFSFKK